MGTMFLNAVGAAALLLAFADDAEGAFYLGALMFLAGPAFFGITYARYRNRGARHYHERETPVRMDKLQVYDTFAKRLTEQRSPTIPGANSQQVKGSLAQSKSLVSVAGMLESVLPSDLRK
ncbi:MAG: hypothetical protein LBH56_00090 [Coriobacteriales bacterium]|jgi:hypothetical protein|nr:hypothetical protein [Coriobacteriales bacterium]